MKIGVLGGTFDPIHLGHLRAAELAREALDLQRVLLVPSAVPPHRSATVSSPLDRFTMVGLATVGHSGFVPSDIEVLREGPSFTIDTLEALSASCPGDELVLIVGSDAFSELPSWRSASAILARWTVAIVDRPGVEWSADRAGGDRIERVEGIGLAVSSTEIRRLAAGGRSIRYLVPEAVAEYIIKRRLYS